MSSSKEIKIPLKVIVDKEKHKVVFAEAGADFVDILLSFLTLPMGTIIRILRKHFGSDAPKIGLFNSLYDTISDLGVDYFQSEECKNILLNTTSHGEVDCRNLKLNIDDTKPTKYFKCASFRCNTYLVTGSRGKTCRKCGTLMNIEMDRSALIGYGNGEVFVFKHKSFLISDDLQIVPNSTASVIGMMNSSGVVDFSVLEERTILLGQEEILNLLKMSVSSSNPLTELVYSKELIITARSVKRESRLSANNPSAGNELVSNFCGMSVKVMVQKSNNKALLAEVDENFLNFIFCFLAFPLGRVASISGFGTCMPNIDNLYRSVSDLTEAKCVREGRMLLYSELDCVYHCGNMILFGEESLYRVARGNLDYGARFLKWIGKFMLTDEWVVTPLSSMSTITYLSALKVSPSDIEEKVVSISLEEGLNILNACVNRKPILTNGLNFNLKKPKQENVM